MSLKYRVTGKKIDILDNLFFNVVVPHFNPKSKFGLVGYVVEVAVGTLVIKKDDRCVEVSFFATKRGHMVV